LSTRRITFSRTGQIDNLLLSATVLAHLKPHSVLWACTSGSFIDALGYAKRQAYALARVADCPASSTSLAFVEACMHFKATILLYWPAIQTPPRRSRCTIAIVA
jgi:maleate cis-trans isomerase